VLDPVAFLAFGVEFSTTQCAIFWFLCWRVRQWVSGTFGRQSW
jgi:hypothetical protein